MLKGALGGGKNHGGQVSKIFLSNCKYVFFFFQNCNKNFSLLLFSDVLSGVIKGGGPGGGAGVSDKELLKEALKVAKTKG